MAEAIKFGTVKVDDAQLKSKAEDAFTKIQGYQRAVESIFSIVTASASHWEGRAGDLYRDILKAQKSEIGDVLTEYANYPKELLAYAGIYSEVIVNTEQKAEEIEALKMF